MTDFAPCGDKLTAIANRVQRLAPCHRDPERFHADKSEVVNDLRKMARGCTAGARAVRGGRP